MNLSNKSSDLKLYSRNKYSDGLPYTSDDLHNEQDLTLRKLGLIMDSIVGSGLLDKVSFDAVNNSSYVNLRISTPTPVNLNGDIFLIGNSVDKYPLSIPTDYTGSIVLLCWYTNVTYNSTLYEYGGLCNNTLTNDIINDKLNIQTSSRYQIRWNIGYCNNIFDYNNPQKTTISFSNSILTESNNVNVTLYPTNMSITGSFYTLPSTTSIPSADGFIHALPLASVSKGTITPYNVKSSMSGVESDNTPSPDLGKVWYNPITNEVKMYFNGGWRNVGSMIIKSDTEPTGNFPDGAIWYNTSLGEFEIYISDIGFVSTYAKMGFVQLQATHTFTESVTPSKNVTIGIPIDTYLSSDLLRVSYEGLELIKDVNYTLNTSNKTITLTDFTINSGETILFTITRLVGSSDLATTLSMLDDHVDSIGNTNSYGHLKLKDTPSSILDETKGVAATPKSVKEVDDKINKYIDEETGDTYELVVRNGVLVLRLKEG